MSFRPLRIKEIVLADLAIDFESSRFRDKSFVLWRFSVSLAYLEDFDDDFVHGGPPVAGAPDPEVHRGLLDPVPRDAVRKLEVHYPVPLPAVPHPRIWNTKVH